MNVFPKYGIKVPSFRNKQKSHWKELIPNAAPLDFDYISKKVDLVKIFSLCVKRFDPLDIEKENIPHDLKFQIMKCMYALIFWSKTPGEKMMKKEDILRGTLLLGSSFADELSDKWEYGIRASHVMHITGTEYKEWEPIVDYNCLPPVHYLINWKETIQDIEYMKIPAKPRKTEIDEEFKEILLNSLPDCLEVPNDSDILTEVKTSVSYSFEEGKSIPFYKARLSPQGREFSHTFKANRCIVPVGPTNWRDTVITSIDTYNSISWCEKICHSVIDNFDTALTHSDPQIFLKRLRRASKYLPKRKYLLRDIKKCGLTFPRRLAHIVQEALMEKYPHIDFSRFNIYRNYSVYDKGKYVETQRGYCLGMGNNLVTLCQCIIFEMLKDRVSANIRGYFGNDDSVVEIEFDNWDNAIEDSILVYQADRQLMEDLDIMTHDKKTFISNYPIIFEEYGMDTMKEKASRFACALSSAILAPSIKYAKMLVNALSPLFNGKEYQTHLLNSIIELWGWEYYPRESLFDFHMGGWISKKENHTFTLLEDIVNLKSEEYSLALKAIKEVSEWQSALLKPKYNPEIKRNLAPLGVTYKLISIIDESKLDKHLPATSLLMGEEEFKAFYQNLFNFSRRPIEFARYLEKRTKRISYPRGEIYLPDLEEAIFSLGLPLRIPERDVYQTTNLFIEAGDSVNIPSGIIRNNVARYLQFLKENGTILSEENIHEFANDDFIKISCYHTAGALGKIVSQSYTLDGYIPEEIYQYSSNPFLPIFDWKERFDNFPIGFLRNQIEKYPHFTFPIKNWKHERSYILYEILRTTLKDYEIEDLFEEFDKIVYVEPQEEVQEELSLCHVHRQAMITSELGDIDYFNIVDEDCIACIKISNYQRIKILSQHDLDHEARHQYMMMIPQARNHLESFLQRIGYEMEDIGYLLGEGVNVFDNLESDEDAGFGMFD